MSTAVKVTLNKVELAALDKMVNNETTGTANRAEMFRLWLHREMNRRKGGGKPRGWEWQSAARVGGRPKGRSQNPAAGAGEVDPDDAATADGITFTAPPLEAAA